MKPRIATVTLPLLLLAPGLVQGKPKKVEVSEAFQTARTVYVESIDGDASRPGVSPADQQAILQVQEAIREWNRYQLAEQRERADLIIVIRKGHAVGDHDHLGLGPQPKAIEPPPPPGSPSRMPSQGGGDPSGSAGTGGDVIASEDLLRVYTLNEKGKLKGPLWSREMDRGLDGPTVHLVLKLKAAVEIAYPREATTQQAAQPGP